MAVFEVTGLRETQDYFQSLPQLIDRVAEIGVSEMSRAALPEAVSNAPIRTGQLRKNIQVSPIVRRASGIIVGGVGVHVRGRYPRRYNGGKSFVYVALRMHRHLIPHNATGGGVYHLGPISSRQGGQVGAEFISRAVLNQAHAYQQTMQRIFNSIVAQRTP